MLHFSGGRCLLMSLSMVASPGSHACSCLEGRTRSREAGRTQLAGGRCRAPRAAGRLLQSGRSLKAGRPDRGSRRSRLGGGGRGRAKQQQGGQGRPGAAAWRAPAAGGREERPAPRSGGSREEREGRRSDVCGRRGAGRGKAARFRISEVGAAFRNAVVGRIFLRLRSK